MDDAINHLKMAAADYRWLTTPNRSTITEAAARENERLANQFDLAAEALRQMHNRLFEEGIVAGVKSLADSCKARRLRKASPASAPEGKALWDSVYKTLRNYRMTMLANSDGDGYPLIDAMSPEQGTVESGIEECAYLADAIYNDLLAAAATPPVSEDRKDAPQEDYFADACRLALELECLLLDCKDTAVTAKWWDSAHEALEQHRERIAAMQEDKP